MLAARALAAAALLASFAADSAPDALGPLFPVAEEDLLGRIESAALGIDAASMRARAAERASAYAHEPPPVAGLSTAQAGSSRLLDPSVRLDEPVLDHAGLTIAAAGELVNPLDHVRLEGRLVLIDERDERQARLATQLRRRPGLTRVILVGGSPTRFAAAHGGRVYFDQQGLISGRLGLREIPAVIEQEGRMLRIDVLDPGSGEQ